MYVEFLGYVLLTCFVSIAVAGTLLALRYLYREWKGR